MSDQIYKCIACRGHGQKLTGDAYGCWPEDCPDCYANGTVNKDFYDQQKQIQRDKFRGLVQSNMRDFRDLDYDDMIQVVGEIFAQKVHSS